MDYPNISICIPIYNRNNFRSLILTNLRSVDYDPHKLEVCIDDDGDEKFFRDKWELEYFKKMISPIKLNYYYTNNRRSIGAKRNNLVKIATHKIIACMDSDDIYLPSYLKHSIDVMRENNATCVGSNQMLFLYPLNDWTTHAIRCKAKRQIHEACMVFTKKHHRCMKGFISRGPQGSQGEGSKMADFNEKNVAVSDIMKCMCCIVHPDNTIDKEMFRKEDNKIDIKFNNDLLLVIASCLKLV